MVVITGGNAGIGRETVLELAKKGCTIIFGARDQIKSEEVLNEVRKQNPEAHVMYFPLDLGDKKSIEAFANRIKEVYDCVNVLINNAGLQSPTRK